MRARGLVVAALVCASATAAAADESDDAWGSVYARQVGDVRVELHNAPRFREDVEPHRVVGIGPDGTELWTIEHRRYDWPFVEPAVVGGRFVYAVRSDLLELDVTHGRIAGRYRFPGKIVALHPVADAGGEPMLDVELEDNLERRNPERTVMRYRLGDIPAGRSYWHMLATFRTLRTANGVWLGNSLDELTETEALSVAARYAAAEARDPTNPYLPLRRGLALAAAGRRAEADAAYRRAAASPGATWDDLIHVAVEMKRYGIEHAQTAFDTGYARMLRAGVRPALVQTLLDTNLHLLHDFAKLVSAAIAAGDADEVDRLETWRWRLYPKLEGAPIAWRVLASWLRAHGRYELARTWTARARAAEDGWLNRVDRRVDTNLNRTAPLVLGLLIAIPIALLIAGIRLARASLGWRPPLAALVTVAVPMLAAFALAATPSGFAQQPRSLDWFWVADSFGSPAVTDALEHQPPSAARDRVLAYARAEAKAVRAGHNLDAPPPSDADLAAALAPAPSWTEALAHADEGVFVRLHWRNVNFNWYAYIDHPLEYAAVFLLPLLLGLALGRWLPRAARIVTEAIPGAQRRLSVASGLAIGAAASALIALLAGYEPPWRQDLADYYGYSAIWRDVGLAPSRAWAWLVLAGVVALQVWLVARARRDSTGAASPRS